MSFFRKWWFLLATLTFALVVNFPLVAAWFRDPSMRFAFPSFVIWATAICLLLRLQRPAPQRVIVWVAALCVIALGQATSFQILKQIGLSVLLPSLLARPSAFASLAVAGISWFPAWGWGFQQIAGTPLDAVRPVLPFAAFLVFRFNASKAI